MAERGPDDQAIAVMVEVARRGRVEVDDVHVVRVERSRHGCAHGERAHAHLHWAEGHTKPRHVEEMEAEQWAHAKMREHGIAVPRVLGAAGTLLSAGLGGFWGRALRAGDRLAVGADVGDVAQAEPEFDGGGQCEGGEKDESKWLHGAKIILSARSYDKIRHSSDRTGASAKTWLQIQTICCGSTWK